MSDACPCASGKPFGECCEPYLLGRVRPPTAVALMRSRYTAYAMGAIDYLYQTSSERVRKEFDAEGSKKWAKSAEWTGIEIIQATDGGAQDASGVIEFLAHYKVKESDFEHHERAEFEKRDGVWVFMDGNIIGPAPVRREAPKVGRNDPCPCGSGRKHKKCCGTAREADEKPKN
jgi:SEC-C motif-containing protein